MIMNFGTPQEMYDENDPEDNKRFGCFSLFLIIILTIIVIYNETNK